MKIIRYLVVSIFFVFVLQLPVLAETEHNGEYMIITAEEVLSFDPVSFNGAECFESIHLKVIGIETSLDSQSGSIVLKTSSSDAVISLKENVAAVGDELLNVHQSPVVVGENIFLPLSYFDLVIPSLVNAEAFKFGRSEDMIASIDILISCSRDIFKLTLPVARDYKKENKNLCLVFFFPGTRINPVFVGDVKESNAVAKVTHESSKFGDRLYFYYRDVGKRFFNAGDVSGDKGRLITINFVEKRHVTDRSDTNSSAAGREITIVLDPGHGGNATGAVGPGGLFEKDVVLDLCRELKAILENNLEVKVVLTRDSDVDISLEERTELANEVKADLFISMHANGAKRHDAQGAETYFLSYESTDDNIRNLAALENYENDDSAAISTPRKSGLSLVLWDLAQSQFLEESSLLADTIQQNLNSYLGVRNRGIKQAPFIVLKGATMPAVLIEIGFITNPEEERKLRQKEYRRRICDAVYSSIVSFKELRDRKLGLSETSGSGTVYEQ